MRFLGETCGRCHRRKEPWQRAATYGTAVLAVAIVAIVGVAVAG